MHEEGEPSHVRAGPAHALPRLPYGFDALEPHIDARTVQIHYRKHHLAYVNALNRAIASHPELHAASPEQLCRNLAMVPSDIRHAVAVAAGGHWNHSRMWTWMTPRGAGAPFGRCAETLAASFGTVETFKDQLVAAAAAVHASGWVWVLKRGGRLAVVTSRDEDNPLMSGERPVLGLDVWEHAYYLKHQNRRLDYVTAWWNVVNWAEVNRCLRE